MTPSEFLKNEHFIQENLKTLTIDQLCGLLDEYADIEVETESKRVKLEMLNALLFNEDISKENYNYYYQKFCK